MLALSRKRKIIIVIASVILIITIAVLSVVMYLRYNYELSMQFEDQNGASKELCIITDDMIERYMCDYRALKRNVYSKGQNTSGVKGKYKEHDDDYVRTKIGSLSGIYVANAFCGNGETVTYTVNSEVKSGNLKIVITDENNKILHEVPLDQEYTVRFESEKDKLYYVKFVGESAELFIEIWREF